MNAKPRIRVRADGSIPKGQAYFGPAGGNYGLGGRAYDAGRYDVRGLHDWWPTINHPDGEVLLSRDKITARARDLDRNHPIISGAIDRREEMVVGPNIRLEAQPDFEALGKTADWADEWATGVEARFRVWGRDHRHLNDVERHSTFGMQVATAYRHWWVDGEACAAIYDLKRGSSYSTSVKLIDPDRLSNPNGLGNGMRLAGNGNRCIGGVEIDENGAPVAYWIRVRHPADVTPDGDNFRWERILAENPTTGRPRFVHAYKRNRAEQRRNVSRMVASLRKTRMFDQYDDAELEAAMFNAVNAGWVESPYPTKDVGEAMAPPGDGDHHRWSLEGQIEYRRERPVHLKGLRVFHGLPGEKFNIVNAARPSPHYPDFQASGLRSIASQFGLSYPQLANKWDAINYSSGRLLMNEIWRGLLHDRWIFTQLYCTPIYAAWLEEDVALGNTKVPGGPRAFYRLASALCMCEWKGPGRGKVDPLKEASAADLDQASGRTNLSVLADEQGQDSRQILLGMVRDKKRREKLGLPDPIYDRANALDVLDSTLRREDAAEHQREQDSGEAQK
ncbi:MAG TPA: phage portal protein [Allosphingosinicella sp.]|nr:phage portal protein [Allosphingosinicella sp.]